MVKFTTSILLVALVSTSTLVNGMVTNCDGSYYCGHGMHQRCDDRTIEHFHHLFHAEVQDGNGELWYPSGGATIACINARKKGSCCVRWNGKMAHGTISEALHYTDVLLQGGCQSCGSTMVDPDHPGELTVNFQHITNPDCDGKLCPGGIKGKRPKETWMKTLKTVETKTMAPEEHTYYVTAGAKSKSEAMVANAEASIKEEMEASKQSSIANAAASAVNSQLDEEKSESSAAMAASASNGQAISKSDTPSDNGDVTVTEKDTMTQTVEPPKTVTKKETDTVKVTRGGRSGPTPTKTPSMTTSVLKSKSSPKKENDSSGSTSSAEENKRPGDVTVTVVVDAPSETDASPIASDSPGTDASTLAGIPPSIS